LRDGKRQSGLVAGGKGSKSKEKELENRLETRALDFNSK